MIYKSAKRAVNKYKCMYFNKSGFRWTLYHRDPKTGEKIVFNVREGINTEMPPDLEKAHPNLKRLRECEIENIQVKKIQNKRVKKPLSVINKRTNRGYLQAEMAWRDGPKGKKIHIAKAINLKKWRGKRCFIIGSGPSLVNYDVRKLNEVLKNENTISINWSFLHFMTKINLTAHYDQIINAPNPNIKKHLDIYLENGGKMCMIDRFNTEINNVCYVKDIGRNGISRNVDRGIFCHSNTGYSAINFAAAIGANPIYLLGYDMKPIDGKFYYHGRQHRENYDVALRTTFKDGIEKLGKDLTKQGWKIINLSRDSILSFRKMDFVDVFAVNKYNFHLKPAYIQDLFMTKYYPKVNMICYISREEAESIGCKTIDDVQKLIGSKNQLFVFREKNSNTTKLV